MTFLDELASQIWAHSEFRSELAILETANFISSLDVSVRPFEPEQPDQMLLARLLQAACIFSSTRSEVLQEVAQRISTAALRVGVAADEGLHDMYALIQSRLANFPALSLAATGAAAPKFAPLTLQYEFVSSRRKQTIHVGENDHLLTSFQMESWQTLNARKSATLTGPTSAGKSYILLIYIAENFRIGTLKSVVYIVPTRALINQVADDMAREMIRRGVDDVEITTVPIDMGGGPDQKTLYVLTQERLEALLIKCPKKTFELIVVDEAQVISHGARGILLEAVLDRLGRNESQSQLIFVGPMIKNPNYFGQILGLSSYKSCSTTQSPVTQKLVFLDYSAHPLSTVAVSIGRSNANATPLTIGLPIRLQTETDKLSYLSYFFGRSGSSIVYCNGKAEAEKIAIKIANQVDPEAYVDDGLSELIRFVKKHVHPEYALVATLQKGVGFHYGHMPSLLRKELEHCFKEKRVSFLACTSTLLYGLNLPARNIFLSKPTTGRGSPISGPDFWNLAGRVGRLGKELEGDVYLIDYDNWSNTPVSESKHVQIISALKESVVDGITEFSKFIESDRVASEFRPEMEIALGKLLIDHRQGRIGEVLGRYRHAENDAQLDQISNRIAQVSKHLDLPAEVIDQNIGVSAFRQKDLLDYMTKRLGKIPVEEMIPAHPLGDFDAVLNNYRRVFKRIHTYLLKYPGGDRRHFFFSALALRWMRGDSLPVLINSSIKFHRDSGKNKSKATIIRNVMENIEDDLRFRYVKFFGSYNSVLKVALERTGFSQYIDSIPDIPLYLEMGGSSGVMINLMALGLSRTTAEEIADYVTDKDMSISSLKNWLEQQDFSIYDLSPVFIREINAVVQGQDDEFATGA